MTKKNRLSSNILLFKKGMGILYLLLIFFIVGCNNSNNTSKIDNIIEFKNIVQFNLADYQVSNGIWSKLGYFGPEVYVNDDYIKIKNIVLNSNDKFKTIEKELGIKNKIIAQIFINAFLLKQCQNCTFLNSYKMNHCKICNSSLSKNKLLNNLNSINSNNSYNNFINIPNSNYQIAPFNKHKETIGCYKCNHRNTVDRYRCEKCNNQIDKFSFSFKGENIKYKIDYTKINENDINKILNFYNTGKSDVLDQKKDKLNHIVLTHHNKHIIRNLLKQTRFYKITMHKNELSKHFKKKHKYSDLKYFLNNCQLNSGPIHLSKTKKFPLNEAKNDTQYTSPNYADSIKFGGGGTKLGNAQEEMLWCSAGLQVILNFLRKFGPLDINNIVLIKDLPILAEFPLLYGKNINRNNRIDEAIKSVKRINPKQVQISSIHAPDLRYGKKGKTFHLFDQLLLNNMVLCLANKDAKKIIFDNGPFGCGVFENDILEVVANILLAHFCLTDYPILKSWRLETILYGINPLTFDVAKKILLYCASNNFSAQEILEKFKMISLKTRWTCPKCGKGNQLKFKACNCPHKYKRDLTNLNLKS